MSATHATLPAAALPRSRRRDRARRVPAAVALLAAVVLVATLKLAAEPMRVGSDSMAPTLQAGDQVIVDKRAFPTGGLPRRGDLVVFRRTPSSDVLLKRVVALPGDSVGIEDGRLVVDGRTPAEPYADRERLDGVYFGPVAVRPGTVFVLGDNRANSVDSRSFGAVPVERLIGRVAARVWPLTRLGRPQ